MALAGERAGQTHACLRRLPHQCPVGADCRPLHLQVRKSPKPDAQKEWAGVTCCDHLVTGNA